MASVVSSHLGVLEVLHKLRDLGVVLLETLLRVRLCSVLKTVGVLVCEYRKVTLIHNSILHKVLHTLGALKALDSGIKLVILPSENLFLFHNRVVQIQIHGAICLVFFGCRIEGLSHPFSRVCVGLKLKCFFCVHW